MVKLIEMDERVSLRTQMQEESGTPVVLINKFNVPAEGVDQFLQTWEADAAFLKTQAGYISAQLHRGISGGICQDPSGEAMTCSRQKVRIHCFDSAGLRRKSSSWCSL